MKFAASAHPLHLTWKNTIELNLPNLAETKQDYTESKRSDSKKTKVLKGNNFFVACIQTPRLQKVDLIHQPLSFQKSYQQALPHSKNSVPSFDVGG